MFVWTMPRDRDRKETLNATVDSDIFERIERERGITARSTWLNHFFEIFFSSNNKLARRIEQFRRDENLEFRAAVERLIERGLEKMK